MEVCPETAHSCPKVDGVIGVAHNRGMEIRVAVYKEVAKQATERAPAAGISLEQAMTTYIRRVAEGSEFENELLPDGTLRRRTLREQIYR